MQIQTTVALAYCSWPGFNSSCVERVGILVLPYSYIAPIQITEGYAARPEIS